MTTPLTTRTATTDELDAVTELCVAAFADEAVTAWVLPDPGTRASLVREHLAASLGAVVEVGGLVLAVAPDDGPVGASVWVPRAASPRPGPRVTPPPDAGARLAVVEAATLARRPAVAHLHLASMGTLPAHRGRGAGAAMLAAGVARARAAGLPVYLEASTPGSRRLYARFGFRDHGEPVALPDGGPVLRPMWLDT